MAWKPRSIVTEGRPKKPPLFTSKGDAGKAIKKRKPRAYVQLDLLDEQAVILASQKVALRHAKEKRAQTMQLLFSKPPTQAQINSLAEMIGTASREQCIRFVEFANQISSGMGSLRPFQKHRIFLSRIYWIRAMRMAETGSNELCNADDEVAQSMGFDTYFDMLSASMDLQS